MRQNLQPTDEIDLWNSRDRIVTSNQGGPIRTALNGRQTKPTGTFISVKSGYRSLVWESKRAELPVLRICELSPRVRWMMSQPHRFEFHTSAFAGPLIYFPDLELDVIPSLVADLDNGVPFGIAALRADPRCHRRGRSRKLVLEVKTEDDPRTHDEFYNEKLRLAAIRYGQLGYVFRIIKKRRDIDCVDARGVERIVLDKLTQITPSNLAAARMHLQGEGGTSTYHRLSCALGSGPLGDARLNAMAVRRNLSIDLSAGFSRCCAVHLLRS